MSSDDLGELGDLDEDEGLGDFDDMDGGLGDGEMGGDMDAGGMEGGDGMAGGGGNVDELEHRLDELENEVGSLSSTVNTVRNENEQISDSVEEVEENVRKLLDIYEMVTRGVNPFADEMDAGMDGGMQAEDSSFGLFTDEEEGSDEEESVDEDIADADAEGFFDDDLVEEEDEDGDVEEIDAEMNDVFDEESADGVDGATGGDGDSSPYDEEFEDIEDEEFIDAGEDDSDAATLDNASVERAEAGDETVQGNQAATPEREETNGQTASTAVDDGESSRSAPVKEADNQPSQVAASGEPVPSADASSSAATDASTKPYLTAIPSGVGTDLILLEWLEYLAGSVGLRRAVEAIDYYETIDWITASVAETLRSHLDRVEAGSRGRLTVEVHRQSLQYLAQLNGSDATGRTVAGFTGGDSP